MFVLGAANCQQIHRSQIWCSVLSVICVRLFGETDVWSKLMTVGIICWALKSDPDIPFEKKPGQADLRIFCAF